MVLIGDTYLICFNGLVLGIWFCEWKLFWFDILYILKRVIEKNTFYHIPYYSEEFMSCSWFYKECWQFKSYDVFQTEPVLSFDEY